MVWVNTHGFEEHDNRRKVIKAYLATASTVEATTKTQDWEILYNCTDTNDCKF
jgi:hypothetical protein